MTRKQEETGKVKAALKYLPYRIKVRHGIGTGSGWIKIYIPRAVWEIENRRVEVLVADAVDRPHTENNHILVTWYE
ncbi:MAG: hypothetical protein Q8J68_14550 [Methanolobus sp.]|uniref:hypothetical protein n=1 Tax=Methanolobus sp. TaxID=1874737 RepID=UPI0027315A9E|nr:hypothetical protein [Methanolobus sp.]MDP2218494.1 hypothetical protein [Methanolobus sp.]